MLIPLEFDCQIMTIPVISPSITVNDNTIRATVCTAILLLASTASATLYSFPPLAFFPSKALKPSRTSILLRLTVWVSS